MNCHRCQGMMVQEKFYNSAEPHENFWGWRCITCGEIVDPTIWQNRQWSNPLQRRRRELGGNNASASMNHEAGQETVT